MSARRCSRRSPSQARILLAPLMRVAFLVPRRTIDLALGLDVRAQRSTADGRDGRSGAWTDAGGFVGLRLVLPLVAWGYHQLFRAWLACSTASSANACGSPTRCRCCAGTATNPISPSLPAGVATVPSLTVNELDDAPSPRPARSSAAKLVVKPLVSASAYGTYGRPGDPLPEAVRGWRMLVQPWLKDIIEERRIFADVLRRRFSHAVGKVPRPGDSACSRI